MIACCGRPLEAAGAARRGTPSLGRSSGGGCSAYRRAALAIGSMLGFAADASHSNSDRAAARLRYRGASFICRFSLYLDSAPQIESTRLCRVAAPDDIRGGGCGDTHDQPSKAATFMRHSTIRWAPTAP